MKKGNTGCITLEVYPQNPDSLLVLNIDELKFPSDIDFGSIRIKGDKGALLFELIEKSGYKKTLDYRNKTDKTHIAIINNGSETIKISYRCSGNSRIKFPKSTLKLSTAGLNLAISTKKASLAIDKTGCISEFLLSGKKYGPLHLVSSGGDIFYQEQHDNPKIDVITDGAIIKIIKAESILKVLGSKSKKKGYFPFSITYTFWSPDGSNIYSTAEIELMFDQAYSFENRKLKYADLMMWYRLDNCMASVKSSALYESKGPDSSIATLAHPYFAYIESHKNAVFGMFPYLALPCDGIHIEKGRNFFGPCWHSLPSEGKPYWGECGLEGDKQAGDNQGYFPANSLRSYWKIGLYFGNGKEIRNASKLFSYPTKIRNATQLGSENNPGNAYMARWKNNKKLAFNAITDDAKINDYLYRANGSIPAWVQAAIATRHLLNVNYHRFCMMGEKIFYLHKYPLLSTFASTMMCLFGSGTSFREKYKGMISFILHTNSHPRFYKLDSRGARKEISASEKIWTYKWKHGIPLSHVLSWTATYGLATEQGTREKIAFSSSKYLQWLREWPIPNAPVDFFLPTPLHWGISSGEMFKVNNCAKIKADLDSRMENGADYMLVSGHCPEYPAQCPPFVSGFFRYVEDNKDIWTASADDIIKYYKSRESIFVGRMEKKGIFFEAEITNALPDHFNTQITLMQCIGNLKKIQCSFDGQEFYDVNFSFADNKQKIAMYNLPTMAKKIRIL